MANSNIFPIVAGPAHVRAQGVPHSDSPPARFVRAWQDATALPGKVQKDGLALLAAHEEWEPHLRSAFNATSDQKVRDSLRPALIKCQANLFTSGTWSVPSFGPKSSISTI